MQNSRGKGWELPSAGIQVMPDAQMGRQGRKFLLEGPEKIATQRQEDQNFSTWDAHNRQSNRMQRVRQGAGRGGRLKGKSTFFVFVITDPQQMQ